MATNKHFIFSLPISVGALYVRRYFQQSSKKTAVEMVTGIRAQFEMILAEVPWMDANTKAAALDKVKAMSTHIGYPDEIMDNLKLEEYYSGLEVNPDTYLESVLRMNVFGTDYAFNKLRKPVNKTDWVTHARPAIVNAFYSSIENSIRKCLQLAMRISRYPVTKSNCFSRFKFRIPGWNLTRTILFR